MSTSRPRINLDFSIKRSAAAAAPKRPQVRMCEFPGCDQPGTHKAPKSKENLREHRWLCMPHVRWVNENWNFFDGMTDAEVQQFQRDAQLGRRPTWKLKDRQSTSWQARGEKATFAGKTDDTYKIFEDGQAARVRSESSGKRTRVVPKLQMDALTVLDLTAEASLNDVKARYKELVKRYHPDVNGGDRSAEERLALVIRAYGVLKKSNFG